MWAKSSGALIEDPTGRILVENLYPYYVRYCEVRGLKAVEQREFTEWLKTHGYNVRRPKNVSTIYGYKLKADVLEQLLRREEEESLGLESYYES
jgi:phage/plasmid-associated DNA primase